MKYFAYDTNLDKKLMKERCPDSKPLFSTTLPNYKLVFLGWSRLWNSGIASIQRKTGSKVPGGLYEISDNDLRHLDKAQNYPIDSNRIKIIVFDDDGTPIEALTYIKSGKDEETKPSKDYAAIIYRNYKDWGII